MSVGKMPELGATPAETYAKTAMVDYADGYSASDIFSSTSRTAYAWDDLLMLPGGAITYPLTYTHAHK